MRRFAEHKAGEGGRYTRANPPKKIRYFEQQPNRSKATKREIEIKQWSRAKKIAWLKSHQKKKCPDDIIYIM